VENIGWFLVCVDDEQALMTSTSFVEVLLEASAVEVLCVDLGWLGCLQVF
jgi:hypothetical protein